MKSCIDIITSNVKITNRVDSHKAAWAYLLANQIKHATGEEVTVLHNWEPWDDFDKVYLYHGMDFTGLLNLYSGAQKYIAERIERILHFKGDITSLDIPMPDFGYLVKRRLTKGADYDPYWDSVDREALTAKSAKVPWIRHPQFTDKLVIGDSHSVSVYYPGCMMIRMDKKTLYGALRCGLKNLISENGVDPSTLNHITLYFGNIDVRHHLARRLDIKGSVNKLVKEYAKQIKDLNVQDVELVELLPIENPERKIPKAGYYKGTPFYGSWETRNKIRGYFNYVLEKVCKFYGWKLYKHHPQIMNEAGELSFDAMERPKNVHLSPRFYRWDLRNDKPIIF